MNQMRLKNLFRYFEYLFNPKHPGHKPCILGVFLDCEATILTLTFQANTQELGKDKWLCPLSGKKFKGPDFVRKHIFNKHAEKVEEVKKEVKYYNNYLKDPKRPQLPESNQKTAQATNGRAPRADQPPHGGDP